MEYGYASYSDVFKHPAICKVRLRIPIDSGPTLLLPYSQQYDEGYLARRAPEFKAYFAEHAVQLELAQGDAMFFNPTLFHAAGSNRTEDFTASLTYFRDVAGDISGIMVAER